MSLTVLPGVLHGLAGELRHCAERVAGVTPRLLGGLAGAGADLSPVTGVPGAAAALLDLSVCCGPGGLPAVAADLAALSLRVQLAGEAYVLADRVLGRRVDGGDRLVGGALGGVAAAALDDLRRASTTAMLATDPLGVLVERLEAPLLALALIAAWEAQRRLLPTTLQPSVDPLLDLVDRVAEGRASVREIDPALAGARGVSAASLGPAATSLAGALSGVRLLSSPAAPSTFAVLRTASGPPPRFVVCLPGLQHWTRTDRSGADVPGALATITGHSSYVAGARAALLQLPTPSRVLLVGHSQGGMVAQALAGDPTLRATGVRVDAVVTAGAPRMAVAIPPGVARLALENDGDPVPRLGALVGPGLLPTQRAGSDESRVVRFPATHARLSMANHTLDGGGYLAAARGADPLVADFRTRVAPFLTGTVASLQVFQVRDGGLPP